MYCFIQIYILIIYIYTVGLRFPNEMSPQLHCLLFILVQFLLLVSARLEVGGGILTRSHWTWQTSDASPQGLFADVNKLLHNSSFEDFFSTEHKGTISS